MTNNNNNNNKTNLFNLNVDFSNMCLCGFKNNVFGGLSLTCTILGGFGVKTFS